MSSRVHTLAGLNIGRANSGASSSSSSATGNTRPVAPPQTISLPSVSLAALATSIPPPLFAPAESLTAPAAPAALHEFERTTYAEIKQYWCDKCKSWHPESGFYPSFIKEGRRQCRACKAAADKAKGYRQRGGGSSSSTADNLPTDTELEAEGAAPAVVSTITTASAPAAGAAAAMSTAPAPTLTTAPAIASASAVAAAAMPTAPAPTPTPTATPTPAPVVPAPKKNTETALPTPPAKRARKSRAATSATRAPAPTPTLSPADAAMVGTANAALGRDLAMEEAMQAGQLIGSAVHQFVTSKRALGK